MKKLLALILAVITCFSVTSLVACKENDEKLQMYVPDGAPALSVARLLDDENIVKGVKINVVGATLIQGYVTGETPKADLAILPVNAASKLLGNASNYQMLGVVTNGNLFIMKKQSGVDITTDNLSDLVGKKVGVMNITNVPGLTFKTILSSNDIAYEDISTSGVASADKVNLIGLTKGEEVVPSSDCDYFVVPEPAATTEENKTQGKLSIAGSLQVLYGGTAGYPQAVIVAKKSVISSNKQTVDEIVSSFSANKTWLENTDTTKIVNAVVKGFVDKEMNRTFTADNLNANVITNCAINFTSAKDARSAVLTYLEKINGISANAWGTPTDAFFYGV